VVDGADMSVVTPRAAMIARLLSSSPSVCPMRGWILVAASVLAEDDALGRWIDEGRTFAASLPPK